MSCIPYQRLGNSTPMTSSVRKPAVSIASHGLGACRSGVAGAASSPPRAGGEAGGVWVETDRSRLAEAPQLVHDEVEREHADDREALADEDADVELAAEEPEGQLVEPEAGDS